MDQNGPRLMSLSLGLIWLDGAPLTDTEKRDFASAIRKACKWFGMPPDDVPLDPVVLRRLFRGVSPGTAKVTKKTISNVKWGLGRVVDMMGCGAEKTGKSAFLPEWETLFSTIEDLYAGVLLRRFGRFCSVRDIVPTEVSDAVADKFRQSLELELRVGNPRRTHRETTRLWNLHIVVLGYHRLRVPSYSRTYVLPWQTFPASLPKEVEAYLIKQTTSDPFDLSTPMRALKPSSVATYRDRLRRLASCAVLAGVESAQLRSLRDLLQPEVLDRGLRYLSKERNTPRLASAVAILAGTIARDYLKKKKPEVQRIFELASRLASKKNGLSQKVRDGLRPLKQEANLARLFLFPTALMRSLMRKARIAAKDAHLFQRALALAILTVCPLRIGSLCSLRLDSHMYWSSGPMKGELSFEFAEGELKNDEPASFPIPKEVADFIRVYIQRFRPLLSSSASQFLFHSKSPDRPKNKGTMSTQLRKLVFKELGFWVYPHLYRHIVHLVVLRRFPGAYALIARVLTHRSIATTIKNYSHFDAELSTRAYQRLVVEVPGGAMRDHLADAAVVAYGLDRERPVHVRR